MKKERHWIVTSYLILLILYSMGNFFVLLFHEQYLISRLHLHSTQISFILFALILGIRFTSLIGILRWKKWAFWTYIVMILLQISFFNHNITGSNIKQRLVAFILIQVELLYLFLIMKKDGISAWEQLE